MDTFVGPGALLELIRDGLLLRRETYRQVSLSPDATKLCLAVAFVAGAASAPIVGPSEQVVLAVALVFGIFITFGILLFEAFLVWGLCRTVLRGQQSFGAVLRPLAVAHAPRLGFLLVPVLGLSWALAVALKLWGFAALLVALKALTDRSWPVAVGMTAALWALLWLLP